MVSMFDCLTSKNSSALQPSVAKAFLAIFPSSCSGYTWTEWFSPSPPFLMLQRKVKFPSPLALEVGQLKHHPDHLVNGEGGRVDVGHLPHILPRLLSVLHLGKISDLYDASTELYMLVKIVVDIWKCFAYFDVTREVFKNQPIHFLAQWGRQQLKQGWMLLNRGRGESERRIYSHLVKRNPSVSWSTRWRDADVVQQGHGTGPSLTM